MSISRIINNGKLASIEIVNSLNWLFSAKRANPFDTKLKFRFLN